MLSCGSTPNTGFRKGDAKLESFMELPLPPTVFLEHLSKIELLMNLRLPFNSLPLSLLLPVVVLLASVPQQAFSWGYTGHRTVGDIAEHLLTRKAKKNLKKLLDNESLAFASIYMDEVRSDPAYDHMYTWHYVAIPDGMTYGEIEKEPRGDIIETTERLIAQLKAGTLEGKDKIEAVKFLCHLIGDIHQPLHVNRPGDRGGNDISVEWHYKTPYNLHKVWDEGMIDQSELSYTELSHHLLRMLDKEDKESWELSGVREWAYESMEFRDSLYNIGDGKLGYRYSYVHFPIVERRLLQAGVRLAAVLNDIFG